jgi:hypothetical protein
MGEMEEDEGAINYLYQNIEEEESDEEKENNEEQIESDYQIALRLQNERN